MKKSKNSDQEKLLEQLPETLFSEFKTMGELNEFMNTMFKRGVEKMLQAELTDHLGYQKHQAQGKGSGNSRNGKSRKIVKTANGQVQIEVPRDRNSEFEPKAVGKRQKVMDNIDSTVISLYAKGLSTRDIEQQIQHIYGVSISSSSISNITNQILDDVTAWQSRPLDSCYLIVWLDGIRLKVREEGKIVNKSIYLIIGLNGSGHKEVLSMWIHKNESASLWMSALDELKSRGVEDILVACSDNLKGLSSAIEAIYPNTLSQLCIVHQIRNTMKYVASKDKRAFTKDLKAVYAAIDLERAERAFQQLEHNWAHKYPYAIKSWIENWEHLSVFFGFPKEIRTIIYTTNIIENLNRQIRKYTKNKLMFPHDQAVKKAVYLAIQQVSFAWNKSIANWPLIANQFSILYPDRCKLNDSSFYSNY